ncbi:MAG: PilC/PilY family type IV pilus protein [Deltaproteobacteria bacterium]|jgi:type IV pilus assembly protein PilY1
MRLESIRRLKCAQLFAWALCFTMIFTGASPAWAGVCSTADLADVPLELMNGSVRVPSILMICMDNAATMDYDVMTNANTATNGFTISGTEYDYMFTGSNGTAIEGVAAVRNAWQSQCYLHNKMFFNPTVTYTPWPTVTGMSFAESNSNVNTPTWDPRNGGSGSYDLTQPWGGVTIKYTTSAAVPPVLIDYPLSRRHFYMVGTDGIPYLIDINDASTAHFFKLVDANTNGIGDPGEYWLVTYANLPSNIQALIPAPSANAYSTLLQSFANWFTYHRKRISAAVNAVGMLVTSSSFTNMLVGMLNSPPKTNTGKIGPVWIKTTFNSIYYDMTSNFLTALYSLPDSSSSRGFSADITDIGDFIQKNGPPIANTGDTSVFINPGYASKTTYPYFLQQYGGSCQAAYVLMITDGASPSHANIANYDGTGCGAYNCGIFGDSYNKTAADGAMYYYKTDLNTSLSNNVPTNYIDKNSMQHMVTYALTFGASGPLYKANPTFNALSAATPGNTCMTGYTCPTWTDPLGSGSVLDDLWHATVNGRGLYMYADNPQQLLQQLLLIKSDIDRRTGTAAAVTANSVQRQLGTKIYQGMYSSATWWGDLVAIPIDVSTGGIGIQEWSARDILIAKNYTTRKVFTSHSGAGETFSTANASHYSLTSNQVNYILGDSSNELPTGNFRQRLYTDASNVVHHYKLGDIAHSQPEYFNNVVYIGANDGMLHAFDSDTGNELFAYIPSMVQGNLWQLTDPGFVDNHKMYVDGSPSVATNLAGTVTYLASGLGKGGKGVFCLKVDKAKDSSVSASDIFNWEYNDPADTDLGYVYGHAYVAQANTGQTVVIFGNGYASTSKNSALYILNAVDGQVIRKFNTGVTGCNGMSSPALIDYNADGIIDYVYAGDLKGNLWKFDLTSSNSSQWSISYGGNPLFTAWDAIGNPQPITSAPDAMMQCVTSLAGTIVVFGTGQYLGIQDMISSKSQAIYGIYDWAFDNPTNSYLGHFMPGGALSHATPKLLQQTVVADSDNYRLVSSNQINYYNPSDASQTGQTHLGWYYLLQGASERVVQDVLIRDYVVYVVSNTHTASFCSGVGGSYLYALNACSGGTKSTPQFDTNGDNKIDSSDTVAFGGATAPPTAMYFDTTMYAPFALDDYLYPTDTGGQITPILITKETGNKLRYWRIIE